MFDEFCISIHSIGSADFQSSPFHLNPLYNGFKWAEQPPKIALSRGGFRPSSGPAEGVGEAG